MSIEADDAVDEQGFTTKQQRFVEEYCVDGNATQAAKRAGYSPSTAYSIGSENLKKPEIKAAIAERLASLALGPAEVTKMTSEIAQSRLNDYMVIREVQGYEQVEQYVTVLISHARNEIKHLEAFIGRNKLTKESRKPFDEKIAALYEKIAEYEFEVDKWGDDVTRLVPGRPVVRRVAELDLVALAEAKDGGRIKSFKHTKEGVVVETYAADAALDKLARMHGLYEKDNKQLQPQRVVRRIGGKSPVAPDGTGA
ncbi:terminase small subunit [Hymenobacter busanensis]|uniref:Terminase small subunit n=2 Tax=Hymenobacter busanensis TaxID=2607656 RepID=A0AA88JZE1_9BACT|nr:terminase small subunit [Hymenobacter busanensis]KAA9333390.1 terminase small subunit [Hymenobacter busanensis]